MGDTALTKNVKTSEYLSYATMDITLDGVTKKIQMPSMDEVVPETGRSESPDPSASCWC